MLGAVAARWGAPGGLLNAGQTEPYLCSHLPAGGSTDQTPTAAEAVRPGMGSVATGCTGKWEVRSLTASACRGNDS